MRFLFVNTIEIINLRDTMSDCIILTVEQYEHLKKYKWCKGIKQDSEELVTVNVTCPKTCD
jgi:hypothetical protein